MLLKYQNSQHLSYQSLINRKHNIKFKNKLLTIRNASKSSFNLKQKNPINCEEDLCLVMELLLKYIVILREKYLMGSIDKKVKWPVGGSNP